jgi:hypothetical protein
MVAGPIVAPAVAPVAPMNNVVMVNQAQQQPAGGEPNAGFVQGNENIALLFQTDREATNVEIALFLKFMSSSAVLFQNVLQVYSYKAASFPNYVPGRGYTFPPMSQLITKVTDKIKFHMPFVTQYWEQTHPGFKTIGSASTATIENLLKFNLGYIVNEKTHPDISILLYGAHLGTAKNLSYDLSYQSLRLGFDYVRRILAAVYGPATTEPIFDPIEERWADWQIMYSAWSIYEALKIYFSSLWPIENTGLTIHSNDEELFTFWSPRVEERLATLNNMVQTYETMLQRRTQDSFKALQVKLEKDSIIKEGYKKRTYPSYKNNKEGQSQLNSITHDKRSKIGKDSILCRNFHDGVCRFEQDHPGRTCKFVHPGERPEVKAEAKESVSKSTSR